MPEVIITGAEGKLEGRYTPGRDEKAPVALILHPSPLDGGTMNNKVVYNLFHIFASRGFATLRFNFRGVGKSDGFFNPKSEGALTDAATAIDWLQKQNHSGKKCWIAGFSFGTYVGMQLLMRRPELHRFVSVAPPCNMWDFNFLSPCPASGLIVHAEHDQIINGEAQRRFVEKLKNQKNIEVEYQIIKQANHFFSNHMADLQQVVGKYIDDQMEIINKEVEEAPLVEEENDLEYYAKIANEETNDEDDD